MDKNDYQGYYDSIWEEIEPHRRKTENGEGARHRDGNVINFSGYQLDQA